jgi:protein N-terminal methyltransferase
MSFTPGRAVDCGCGIGRVTKRLLLPVFQTVDMVDINEAFLNEAGNFLGPDASRVERKICSSLHQFVPELNRYDAVWCQWVLGHLTEDDLVAFFLRCKQGLTSSGLIFIKENMGSGDKPDFDEKDRSWTRPRTIWLKLIDRAGLKVVKEELQPSFPKDLYEVRMFALK